jgi:hypothetical protein
MGREPERSRPFYFRGCDLTAEYLPATEEVRVRFPATAPNPYRLRVSTRPGFQNPAHSGRHGGSLPIPWGRGRQAMHLLCKQADVGAIPTDSTNFNRGENEIQASLISSASVGATPTPATTACAGPTKGSDPAARL